MRTCSLGPQSQFAARPPLEAHGDAAQPAHLQGPWAAHSQTVKVVSSVMRISL